MLRARSILLGSRGQVGLAMINAVCGGRRGVSDADFDRVEFPVVGRWNEGQAVFMAHEVGNFAENRSKVLVGSREINAASICTRYGLEFFVGLGKALRGGLYFL